MRAQNYERQGRFAGTVVLPWALLSWSVFTEAAPATIKEEITVEVQVDRAWFVNQTANFIAPYTAKAGDTYESIARTYFGDASYAETISRENGKRVDSAVRPESYLRIPVKRFCMLFNRDQADFQHRLIQAFLGASGKSHKLTYGWEGRLELPGGTNTIEDLMSRVFVPSRLVVRWMDDEKVGLSLSFVAGSWLEAHGGDLTIEWIRPMGITLNIPRGAGETEVFVRRDPKEFLEEYEALEKANETNKMSEMVNREVPVVFEAVRRLLVTALQCKHSEDAADAHRADEFVLRAQSMARFFPQELGRDGMQAVIAAYSAWSTAQLSVRATGFGKLNTSKELVRQEKFDAALQTLGEAQELFHRLNDGLGEYNVYIQIAEVYKAANDLENMQTNMIKARMLSLGYGDITDAARLLGYYGIAFQLRENYAEALNQLKKALEEYARAGISQREAGIHLGLSKVYERMGDYDNALYHNQRAFVIAQHARMWGGSQEDPHGILSQKADLYRLMKQYEKALTIYNELIAVATREQNIELNLNLNYEKAVVYQSMGRDEEALELFTNVLARGEQISQPPKESLQSLIDVRHKWVDEGKVLAHTGRSYYRRADYNKALRQFHEGMTYYDEKKDTIGIIETEYWIGLTYIKLDFPDDAIRFFNYARAGSEQIGIKEMDWELSYGVAMAHFTAGRLEKALQYFSSAEEAMGHRFITRSWYEQDAIRSAVETKRDFYLQYAGLLLKLEKQHPGQGYDRQLFTIAERAKSILFQESIARASANNTLGRTPEFQRQLAIERMRISQVALLANQVAQGDGGAAPQGSIMGRSLEERLIEAQSDLSSERQLLERNYPRYADLARPKALTVEEVQSILNSNETLLSYLVRDKDTIVFLVNKEAFHVTPVSIKRQDLDSLVEKFHIGIDRTMNLEGAVPISDDPNDLTQFDPSVAYALYEALFRPIEHWIPAQDSKLYIAADGALFTIPFEALIDQPVDMDRFRQIAHKAWTGEPPFLSQYDRLHYLIDTFTIAYIPSASVLRSLRLYRKPAPQIGREPLIAFADPVFDAGSTDDEYGTERVQYPKRRTLALGLARLAGSAREAREICGLLGGHTNYILLRENASEANVYRLPLNTARYVLFSTHGLLSSGYRGAINEPALVLSLVDNPPEYDGLLTVSKILGLDLNAESVILSACETYGREADSGSGEGFADFARSFMYAGASSLLVSHWKVDDYATRMLLVDTFRKKNGSLVSALRESKQAMRKVYRRMEQASAIKVSLSHPFFWAPFVYVGE